MKFCTFTWRTRMDFEESGEVSAERSRSIDGNNDMFAMMKPDTVITVPRIFAVSSRIVEITAALTAS